MAEFVLPEVPVRVSPATRLTGRLAVAAAGKLAGKPPKRLREILVRASSGARAATYEEAKLARDEILMISPACRGRNACLPRSISTALLCRTRGIWPTWCVGVVASPPFGAHAWLEVDGDIVDEPIGSDFYRSFFRVAPPGSVPRT
ncbi:lasso peptide biosynthesis B2 protein [Streptomyces sp. NPDC055189]